MTGLLKPRIFSKYYNNSKWTINTSCVENQNIRLGVYGNVAHIEGWIILKGTPYQKTLVSGFPKAVGEQTLPAWDQYNSASVAFYLKNSTNSLEITGAYNCLDNRNGHYINLAGTYIINNDPKFSW